MGKLIIIVMVGMAVIFTTVSLNVQDKVRTDAPEMIEQNIGDVHAQQLSVYALNMAIRNFKDNADPENDNTYTFPFASTYCLNNQGHIGNVTTQKGTNAAGETTWTFTSNVTWYGDGFVNGKNSSSKAVLTMSAGGFNPNLKEQYKLDEGSGNTTSGLTGNGQGDIVGNTWQWTNGKFQKGLDMTRDYVKDNSGITNGIGNQFTVSTWIKPSSFLVDAGHIVGETNAWLMNAFIISSWIYNKMNLRFTIKSSSGNYSTRARHTYWFSTVIWDWFFVVASYDGPHNQISVAFTDRDNHTYSANAWAPSDWLAGNGDVYIGGADAPHIDLPGFWGWLLNFLSKSLVSFNGKMDEVAIYDKVLTPAEILQQKANLLPYIGGTGTLRLSSWVE